MVGFSAVLVATVWSGVCSAQVMNLSFEATYDGLPWPRPLPLYWARVDNPSFNSYCTDIWSTDGDLSACLFSRAGKTFVAGKYQSFCQFVDLTDVGIIAFDAMLTSNPAGPFAHFEASLLVDDVPLWTETVEGEYLDQEVDVSELTDLHMVELRITAIEDGTFDESYWTLWDNVQLLEGPRTVEAAVDADPGTLILGGCGKWITCYIELPEGYDAAEIDASTVTLEDIGAYTETRQWRRWWGRWWGPWRSGRWARAEAGNRNIVDRDRDGLRERVIRFERDSVEAVVQAPETTVVIAGQLNDGTPFEGAVTIRVIDRRCRRR